MNQRIIWPEANQTGLDRVEIHLSGTNLASVQVIEVDPDATEYTFTDLDYQFGYHCEVKAYYEDESVLNLKVNDIEGGYHDTGPYNVRALPIRQMKIIVGNSFNLPACIVTADGQRRYTSLNIDGEYLASAVDSNRWFFDVSDSQAVGFNCDPDEGLCEVDLSPLVGFEGTVVLIGTDADSDDWQAELYFGTYEAGVKLWGPNNGVELGEEMTDPFYPELVGTIVAEISTPDPL